MPRKYVRVFIEASQTEMSVTEDYAKTVGLEPLTDSNGDPKPAENKSGGPLPDKRKIDKGTGEPTPLPTSVDELEITHAAAEADQEGEPEADQDDDDSDQFNRQ